MPARSLGVGTIGRRYTGRYGTMYGSREAAGRSYRAAGGGINLSSLLSGYQSAAESARAANIARKEEIKGLYGQMMKRFQPGGTLQKTGLAKIERAKTKGVGQEMQHMISSGLYGTTTAAGVPRRWEEDIGVPARLKLEDIMAQGLTGVQTGLAGFLERIEEPYPDYNVLMQMMSALGGR